MEKLVSAALVSLLTISPAFAATVKIDHYMGTTEVEQSPKRVVVIGFGPLDMLDSFNIDPVAVSNASHLPKYLSKYNKDNYTSAGSLFEPDFETIYMQKPDLILVGPRGSSKYDELSEIAPTVVFASGEKEDYWQGTKGQWRNLGKIFNIEDKVEQKIENLDAQFKAIREYNQTNNNDALTILSIGDNISAFGAKSRFGAIYTDFGFTETVKNLKTGTHGDVISYEFIREANPKNILVIDRNSLHAKSDNDLAKALDNDLVKATSAYKNKKITFLDVDAWYLAMSGVTATEKMVSEIKHTIDL
ncbi:siderophore ABC transporter substrate-binding protein [Vibrio owensii]|jgi:iron complex transport system substrate-binding protein|uniref:ABC transporter substrate-binding protein n=1 Tax=Vibrio owensii TaxID=696485 RepID=A0AAP9GGV2_9VIBR|nr:MULTISPECIES: siderophore ABC transporter substrate-binding protein [Vibrio]AYO17425.1 siderophore ABC transporter substrate-binding protein [Vibrio owensii]MCF6452587.1 siderophore ABC transporter substrate-binding protein [Vibrio sp. MMG023]QGH49567.1 ABC transporter substrate-binding protein [Vibrio owensii]